MNDIELNLYNRLVYRQDNVLSDIEVVAKQGKVSAELSILAHAVLGKTELTESPGLNEQSLFALEAKMLTFKFHNKYHDALLLASEIVKKYPMAGFARYLLASNGLRNKRPQETVEHSLIFLQHYPQHENAIFLLAEGLAYLRQYREAMTWIKRCKSSLKQRLYLIMVPSVLPKYRFLLLLVGIFLAVIKLNALVLLVAILLLLVGAVTSMFAYKGTLIPARLLYWILMLLASWGFGRWVLYLLMAGQ